MKTATMKLTDAEVAIVKGMLGRGDKNQDIAAYFGVNQGRIAEIRTGKDRPAIKARKSGLPPAGPGMSGRATEQAEQALLSAKHAIDAALGIIAASRSIANARSDK